MVRRHRISTLFPYTTLFRSQARVRALRVGRHLLEGRVEGGRQQDRSEEHTSELQSQSNLVCRLLLEKKKLSLELLPALVDGGARAPCGRSVSPFLALRPSYR